MKKIVVGIDDTSTSRVALVKALEYAVALDAEVDVVFVSQMPTTLLTMGGMPLIESDYMNAQRKIVWQNVAAILSATQSPIERVDLDGYPPDVLVDHARQVDADLLVVGSRGRGDFASLLLGSTSHRVVNNAPCDVLVVQHEEG